MNREKASARLSGRVFKGYRGKYLKYLNLYIKMLLYEKGVMDIVSDQ